MDKDHLNCFIRLSNGYEMPTVGLGTCHIKDEESVRKVVTEAIDAGYRYFDTAFSYMNEKLLGKVLNEMFQNGKIKREELFIASKLPLNGMQPDSVEYFFKLSLNALQLEYVDLYLIHFPVPSKRSDQDMEFLVFEDGHAVTDDIDLRETWKAMESLAENGLAKSIGLSNCNKKQIQRIYDSATIKPTVLQVECHAYLPQYELHEFCRKLNIAFTAYSPLGSPNHAEFARNFMGMKDYIPTHCSKQIAENITERYKKSSAR
ncbi:aldo-keto reductase family 1 member A1 [Nephila pilipes]|uniref:Aldo-keto reductase family 1 member A1 n=1 Tax=Nephila pilipes TaxID=299642 RepID=A0A8X6Q780_NEPPI|nr:aldo-keto reductase family 1 member A1 [Nephila pilipes]